MSDVEEPVKDVEGDMKSVEEALRVVKAFPVKAERLRHQETQLMVAVFLFKRRENSLTQW